MIDGMVIIRHGTYEVRYGVIIIITRKDFSIFRLNKDHRDDDVC